MFLSLFKSGASDSRYHNHRGMVGLYKNPNVASCVFRALDDLSKTIVLRMLCGNITLYETAMTYMVLEGKDSKELKVSLKELEELSIMRKQSDHYSLHDKFRISLEKYITEPQQLPSFPVPNELREEESAPLHYLLEEPPTQTVRKLLVDSMLITEHHGVTRQGFGFYLSDLSKQVCILMQSYAAHDVQLWQSILELSLLDLDRAYPCQRWKQSLLKDLNSLMFVTLLEMNVNGTTKMLVRVNRIFRNFSFMQPEVDLSLKCDIIVETNFKIYAHIKAGKDRRNYIIIKRILELFVQLEHQDSDFQELIVGTLTQDSIQQAYAKKISADQILQFFRKHTDPRRLEQAQKKTQLLNKHDVVYNQKREKLKFLKIYSKEERDIIPNNVIQEVKLWESMEGTLMNEQFENSSQGD